MYGKSSMASEMFNFDLEESSPDVIMIGDGDKLSSLGRASGGKLSKKVKLNQTNFMEQDAMDLLDSLNNWESDIDKPTEDKTSLKYKIEPEIIKKQLGGEELWFKVLGLAGFRKFRAIFERSDQVLEVLTKYKPIELLAPLETHEHNDLNMLKRLDCKIFNKQNNSVNLNLPSTSKCEGVKSSKNVIKNSMVTRMQVLLNRTKMREEELNKKVVKEVSEEGPKCDGLQAQITVNSKLLPVSEDVSAEKNVLSMTERMQALVNQAETTKRKCLDLNMEEVKSKNIKTSNCNDIPVNIIPEDVSRKTKRNSKKFCNNNTSKDVVIPVSETPELINHSRIGKVNKVDLSNVEKTSPIILRASKRGYWKISKTTTSKPAPVCEDVTRRTEQETGKYRNTTTTNPQVPVKNTLQNMYHSAKYFKETNTVKHFKKVRSNKDQIKTSRCSAEKSTKIEHVSRRTEDEWEPSNTGLCKQVKLSSAKVNFDNKISNDNVKTHQEGLVLDKKDYDAKPKSKIACKSKTLRCSAEKSTKIEHVSRRTENKSEPSNTGTLESCKQVKLSSAQEIFDNKISNDNVKTHQEGLVLDEKDYDAKPKSIIECKSKQVERDSNSGFVKNVPQNVKLTSTETQELVNIEDSIDSINRFVIWKNDNKVCQDDPKDILDTTTKKHSYNAPTYTQDGSYVKMIPGSPKRNPILKHNPAFPARPNYKLANDKVDITNANKPFLNLPTVHSNHIPRVIVNNKPTSPVKANVQSINIEDGLSNKPFLRVPTVHSNHIPRAILNNKPTSPVKTNLQSINSEDGLSNKPFLRVPTVHSNHIPRAILNNKPASPVKANLQSINIQDGLSNKPVLKVPAVHSNHIPGVILNNKPTSPVKANLQPIIIQDGLPPSSLCGIKKTNGQFIYVSAVNLHDMPGLTANNKPESQIKPQMNAAGPRQLWAYPLSISQNTMMIKIKDQFYPFKQLKRINLKRNPEVVDLDPQHSNEQVATTHTKMVSPKTAVAATNSNITQVIKVHQGSSAIDRTIINTDLQPRQGITKQTVLNPQMGTVGPRTTEIKNVTKIVPNVQGNTQPQAGRVYAKIIQPQNATNIQENIQKGNSDIKQQMVYPTTIRTNDRTKFVSNVQTYVVKPPTRVYARTPQRKDVTIPPSVQNEIRKVTPQTMTVYPRTKQTKDAITNRSNLNRPNKNDNEGCTSLKLKQTNFRSYRDVTTNGTNLNKPNRKNVEVSTKLKDTISNYQRLNIKTLKQRSSEPIIIDLT